MRRLYAGLLKAEAFIAGTFLLAMVALIFVGGLARLWQHPLNWTTDAATCLFAWACFLCADIAWRRNSLMSIDLFTELMSPRAQRVCLWFNYVAISLFLLYVSIMGLWLSWVSRARSFQGIPEISYSWVTASAVVGGFLLFTTTALKIIDELRGKRSGPVTATDVL